MYGPDLARRDIQVMLLTLNQAFLTLDVLVSYWLLSEESAVVVSWGFMDQRLILGYFSLYEIEWP